MLKFQHTSSVEYCNQGVMLSYENKKQEAIECYDKVIGLDSTYTTAYHNKSISLFILGKKQEAIECCNKTIECNKTYINAYKSKLLFLESLGALEQAKEECLTQIKALEGKSKKTQQLSDFEQVTSSTQQNKETGAEKSQDKSDASLMEVPTETLSSLQLVGENSDNPDLM